MSEISLGLIGYWIVDYYFEHLVKDAEPSRTKVAIRTIMLMFATVDLFKDWKEVAEEFRSVKA